MTTTIVVMRLLLSKTKMIDSYIRFMVAAANQDFAVLVFPAMNVRRSPLSLKTLMEDPFKRSRKQELVFWLIGLPMLIIITSILTLGWIGNKELF